MKKKAKIGCLWTVVIVVYLILVFLSALHVPMSLLLRMLPPIVVVVLLLRGNPLWVKGVVVGLLLLIGGYTLFNNDIVGPNEFLISDRPINVPGQFYYSWRYYWVMEYLNMVAWRWGFISVAFIILRKACERFFVSK